MVLRLAAGLARSQDAGQQWRKIAVPIAAAISTALLLLAASLVTLAHREDARSQARVGALAATPSATDLLWLERGDDHRSRQFAVVWLEAAGDENPVLPPGLRALPAPGEAVVSPGLDRLIRRDPALARRYPKRRVLASSGVRSRGELLAYLSPPPGRSIRDHGSTVRLSGFGDAAQGTPVALNLESAVASEALVGGSMAFLVIPGVLVLLAGAATSSRSREHRFAILRALGAGERTVAGIASWECALMSAPGILAATAAWAAISGRLDAVPGTGHLVVTADLGLPVLAYAGVAAGQLGLCAVLSLALYARPSARRATARPGAGRQGARTLRLLPLGLSLGLAFGAAGLGGRVGATAMLIAMVGALASLPLAGARVVPALGALLARLPSTAALLAGRRLQWNPIHQGRPFAIAGSLVLLTILTGCYVAILRSTEAGRVPSGPVSAAVVRWVDARDGDVLRLQRELGQGAVVPVAETATGLSVLVPCQQLESSLRLRCDAGGGVPSELARLVGLPGPDAISFARGGSGSAPSAAVVLDQAEVAELDARVRTAAQTSLPAPTIESAAGRLRRASILDRWLETGLAVAGLALALASLALILDGSLRARTTNQVLVRVGMPARDLARLEAALFGLPFAALTLLGALVGGIFAVVFENAAGVGIPGSWVAGIGAATVALWLTGTGAIGYLASRMPVPAREETALRS